jgi:hypothetical protein
MKRAQRALTKAVRLNTTGVDDADSTDYSKPKTTSTKAMVRYNRRQSEVGEQKQVLAQVLQRQGKFKEADTTRQEALAAKLGVCCMLSLS